MEYTAYSVGLNLLYLAAALATIHGALWWGNKTTGVSFSENIKPEIFKSSVGVAIYYGLRFFGVCYLAASLLH